MLKEPPKAFNLSDLDLEELAQYSEVHQRLYAEAKEMRAAQLERLYQDLCLLLDTLGDRAYSLGLGAVANHRAGIDARGTEIAALYRSLKDVLEELKLRGENVN